MGDKSRRLKTNVSNPEAQRIETLSLGSSEEDIARLVNHAGHFRCDLLELNTGGKKKLRFLIAEVMNSVGKPDYAEELAASVLELAFNALKANYAYVVVMNLMKERFQDRADKFADRISFFSDRILQRTYMGLVHSASVHGKVKEALRAEKKIFDTREKAARQKRELTPDEEKTIADSQAQFETIVNFRVKSTLRFVKTPNKLVIDVINDAPISQTGLDRIRKKRDDFRKYYKENRVEEFYTENLDESESAGFGSAIIDSRFLQWGFDPDTHFQVLALNNKTCASLTLTF